MAGQAGEHALRFAVLGPVQAWRDGQELDLGTPLQRSILAMLLLREGRAVTPAEIIDGVWGDDAPPRALGALRTYVSRLRSVLEQRRTPRERRELIASVGRGYALRLGTAALDLTEFERGCAAAEAARRDGDTRGAADTLRAALDLWTGEPLAGAVGPFAETQRGRLAERRVGVVEALMDLDLRLGRHAEVVSELKALTAEHPLREGLRAQLMLAYYRCGRQADALAVYADTRRTLIDELGIEPGPELTALQHRILAADPALDAEPAAGDGPQVREAEIPRPAQLPAAVSDFTGRKELVDKLCALLTSGTGVPIAAVSGIGGVGKTTLAVHVAHSVQDRFPDGQLYVDMRGYSDDPLPADAALGSFLRGLGIPADIIPDGVAERSALFRSLLADRRILVLIDNARDAGHVTPLMPGSPGCAAIVTGRAKLADLPSARLIDLDIMEPDEALNLFAAVAGADRVAAEHAAAMDVVAACGYLPLAVRVVAARLAARPSWTVASLAPRLADERRRLDELKVGNLAVEATFALGYGQLDPGQQRAFRLLSLPARSGISVGAAAAVLALDPMTTEDLLESLVDASLLEASAPGRYRFHDLLKLFARRRAEATDEPRVRAAALGRLLGFYLASVRSAHRLAYEGSGVADRLSATEVDGLSFTSADTAAAWLALEGEDMFAAIDQAIEAGGQDDGSLLMCADVLLGMEPLVEPGTHARESDQRPRPVLAAAQPAGPGAPWAAPAEVRCRYVLGRVLFGANRRDEAREQFLAALKVSQATGDRIVYGETLNALGVVTSRLRRHEEALRWFDAALEAYRELGVPAGEGLVLSYSARDHLLLGRPGDAIATAERALAIFQRIGSGAGVARARYHLGTVLSHVGRHTEAVTRYAECLDFFRASEQRVWEQRVCHRLAETFIAAGGFAEAARYAEQALTVAREIGHPYGEAQSLTVLGKALRGLGDAERSAGHLRGAFDIFSRLGAPEAAELRGMLNLDQVEG